MFKFLKTKDEPPDEEIIGEVEFCSPVQPKEVFEKSSNLDNFINNLKQENGERS